MEFYTSLQRSLSRRTYTLLCTPEDLHSVWLTLSCLTNNLWLLRKTGVQNKMQTQSKPDAAPCHLVVSTNSGGLRAFVSAVLLCSVGDCSPQKTPKAPKPISNPNHLKHQQQCFSDTGNTQLPAKRNTLPPPLLHFFFVFHVSQFLKIGFRYT